MTVTKDYFTVHHGKLELQIPRKLFTGVEADIVPCEEKEFRSTVKSRYPWVSDNAVDVILRNAKREMLRVLDEETDGMNSVRIKVKEGDYGTAIALMEGIVEKHPDNTVYWRTLGELLMKVGRTEEAHRAFSR